MKSQRSYRGSGSAGNQYFPWILAVFIAVVFFASGHSLRARMEPGFRSGSEAFIDAAVTHAAEGSTVRKISLAMLGFYGLAATVFSRRSNPTRVTLLGPLLLILVFWVIISVLWTDEFGLSTRRLMAFLCLCIGSVATAKRLRVPRDLIFLVFFVCGSCLIVGMAAEIVHGTFRPLVESYRFGGTLHPNLQGLNCAIFMLSALAMANCSSHSRKFFLACVALALLFLLLTRSRTAIASGLVAVFFFRNLIAHWTRRAVLLLLAVIAFSVLMFVFGDALFETLRVVVLFGRNVDEPSAGQLAGRIPLFLECYEYYLQRPILGYGYGSFWTPERIANISASQGWGTAGAHSIYLDVALELGGIGLAVFVTTCAAALREARKSWRRTRDVGYAFFCGFVVLLLLDGLLESIFLATAFPLFVVMVICVSLGFRQPQEALVGGDRASLRSSGRSV